MENMDAAAAVLEANPYIINLRQLAKLSFIILMVFILIALLLKIVLDFRKYHYKD
ncbi:MAG: hypothetical protein IKP86_04175 [Anaerolineaceae bacterium]|nr:hypothetical protein [Anaerolineaceae bacterium]